MARTAVLLTRALHDDIVDAVRTGCTRTAAAQRAGVSALVMKAWMYRGALVDDLNLPVHPDHYAFARAVERAEANVENELVGYIKDAAVDDWKAAIALLERRFPKSWSLKQTGDVAALDALTEKLLDVVRVTLGPAAYEKVLEHLVDGKPLPESFEEAPPAPMAPRLDS